MQFGRPEQFHDKIVVRLRAIDRAVAQYQFSADSLKKPIAPTLTHETALFIKGFGNEINLLSATRELYFASRELLDVYLGRLSTSTKRTGKQTPKDCIPFLKRLMAGDFDDLPDPIFQFMKTNVNYIYHIRAVRNELKKNPSNAEFIFNTNHFELRMPLPVKTDESALFPYLDIPNQADAIERKQYIMTLNLDILFPEMKQFWVAMGSMLTSTSAA
jgi:hypothetical protein